VAELDVALPARPEIANLLTYWMKTLGAENGTTYSSEQAQMYEDPICPLFPTLSAEGDLDPMNLSNFVAPLLLLAVFMGLAIATRLLRQAGEHVVEHVAEHVAEQGGDVAGGLTASLKGMGRKAKVTPDTPAVPDMSEQHAAPAADLVQHVQPSPLQTIEASVKVITAQLQLALQAEKAKAP
jgi:hypothetical protein